MKARVRTEMQLNFLMFSSIHKEIMKRVDGRYVASVRIKKNGKEINKDYLITVMNGEVNFGEALDEKGIEGFEVVSVEKVSI